MATIISKINLGLKDQTIFIKSQKYSNKETIETFQVPTEKLSDFIAKTQDVTEVVFKGPTTYLKTVQKDTEKKEKSLYNKIKTKFTFL